MDRRPTEAIVETLAAAADVEPTALPPLDEFVDLDARGGRSWIAAGTPTPGHA